MRILIPDDAQLIAFLAGDDVEVAIAIQIKCLHQVILQTFRPAECALLPRAAALLLQPHDAFERAFGVFAGEKQVGQRIAVEYARSEPDLVRVTGRDARVAIVPAGSVIVVTWLIATPVLLYLRRRP